MMSSKYSNNSIEANKSTWTNNLRWSSKPKRDTKIPLVEKISDLTRMPTNRQILGNFAFLFENKKGRQDRINIMIPDIELLWNEILNFPICSRALIRNKLNRLLEQSTRDRKRPTEKFSSFISELFDVTNVKGQWKNIEDKELYQKQINSRGKIGYSTVKEAPLKSIHPRKRICQTTKTKSVPDSFSGMFYINVSSLNLLF